MIKISNIDKSLKYCNQLLFFFFLNAVFSFVHAQEGQLEKLEKQRKYLAESYNGAVKSKGNERAYYEQKFLEAFPSSFLEIEEVYFKNSREHNSFSDLFDEYAAGMKFFHQLCYVNKKLYYNKYIDIALNGSCEDIYYKIIDFYKDGLFEKVFYDTKEILSELSKRKEQEILSFLKYVLKKPLPSYLVYQEIYKKLYEKIKTVNRKVARMPSVKGLFEGYIEMDNRLELLIECYEKAINLSGKERAKYEQIFFEAFPSSFNAIYDMYSYRGQQEKSKHINFFQGLTYIDQNLYFTKYISLCINRPWLQDGGFSTGLENKLINYTEAVVSILSQRTDQEIKSVFRFLFDGAHPDNEFNEARYNKLYAIIKPVNNHVASLMKETFQTILSEEHCSCH